MRRRTEITLSDLEALIAGTYFIEEDTNAEAYIEDYMEREGMSRDEAIRAAFWEIQDILEEQPAPKVDTE